MRYYRIYNDHGQYVGFKRVLGTGDIQYLNNNTGKWSSEAIFHCLDFDILLTTPPAYIITSYVKSEAVKKQWKAGRKNAGRKRNKIKNR